MRRGGDDRIIRASRAIEHPGRNLKPPSRIGAAQRAAENNIIRLGDRLVDEDRQTKPWMPPIQELAKTGPVGVIKLGCTIRADDTHRSGICHPSSSSANLQRRPSNPGHTSMLSCSRLSRSGLETSQQASPSTCRPSLTAARHDSLGNVQAGTKRCSRPNQKIAQKSQKRRTECSQIRYPDPKTSPLHETGASPSHRLGQEIKVPNSPILLSCIPHRTAAPLLASHQPLLPDVDCSRILRVEPREDR